MGENRQKSVKERPQNKNLKRDAGPGRPTGQKNYATLYREALTNLAKLNGKKPSELELEIISKGLTSARKGDYRFYKDLLDRLFGQAPKILDIEGDIGIRGAKELAALLDETLDENIPNDPEAEKGSPSDSQ